MPQIGTVGTATLQELETGQEAASLPGPTGKKVWESIFQLHSLPSLGSPGDTPPLAKSDWKPDYRGVCGCSQHGSASQDTEQAGEG